MKIIASALCVGALAGACAMPRLQAVEAQPDAAAASSEVLPSGQTGWASQPRREPLLYARDGSVVNSQRAGTVAVAPQTGQDSTGRDGSRWTLLERYNEAVSNQEQLEYEVHALSSELDVADTSMARMSVEIDTLKNLVVELEGQTELLQGENLELANRLTTAQIRRLQSEKLLLEAKLDWKRVQAVINQPAAKSGEALPAAVGEKPGASVPEKQ